MGIHDVRQRQLASIHMDLLPAGYSTFRHKSRSFPRSQRNFSPGFRHPAVPCAGPHDRATVPKRSGSRGFPARIRCTWNPSAWISERKDVLSTLCEMAALLLYTRYIEVKTLPRYLAVMFAFALGLMAKPMLVTFPFILLLLDYWPLRRLDWPPTWQTAKPLVLEKIPLLALSLVGSVLTLAAQREFGAVAGLQVFPLATRWQIRRGRTWHILDNPSGQRTPPF